MVGEAERLEVEEGSDRRAPLGGVCVRERPGGARGRRFGPGRAGPGGLCEREKGRGKK